MVQFNSDGTVDSSFGSDGAPIHSWPTAETAEAVAIAGDRSILVAGGVRDASGAS